LTLKVLRGCPRKDRVWSAGCGQVTRQWKAVLGETERGTTGVFFPLVEKKGERVVCGLGDVEVGCEEKVVGSRTRTTPRLIQGDWVPWFPFITNRNLPLVLSTAVALAAWLHQRKICWLLALSNKSVR